MYSDISDERSFQLAVNLWNLAIKQRSNVKSSDFLCYIRSIEDEVELCEDDNQRKARLVELYNRVKAKL